MHKDLGLPTPWMDSGLCASFVRSASILVSSAAPEHPYRKPLLAEHLLLFLSVAMFSSDLYLVRSTVAVTLAFLSFVRGASVMSLLSSDVRVSLPSIEVVVWDEKTRKGSGIARSVSILCADCVLVGQLVHKFLAMQLQSFSGAPFQGFLQLPGESFPLSEGILNKCMQQCVAAAGLSGLYGASLHGHSCRSGGVSALHAIGGSLPLAAARGGWQFLATVFQHYLSFEVLPSKEAFLLLGFLLPPPAYVAGRSAYGL